MTGEAATWLIRNLPQKEIKAALFDMNPHRTPSPNGYYCSFYQRNWNLIKGDVISAINSFFESGKLLKKINHSFLALVLKSNDASSLSEYRPISCYNVLYKLVTKVLSKRLELAIGKLISAN